MREAAAFKEKIVRQWRTILLFLFAILLIMAAPSLSWADESASEKDRIYAIYYNNPDGKSYTLVIQNGTELDPNYPPPPATQITEIVEGFGFNGGPGLNGYSEFTTNVMVKAGVKPASMSYWFHGFERLESVDFSGLDSSRIECLDNLFTYCYQLTSVDFSSLDLSNVKSANEMFECCESLKTVSFPRSGLPNLSEAEGVFSGCRSLKSIDFVAFSKSPLRTLDRAFLNCESLQYADMSSLNLTKLISCDSIFENCTNLKRIVFPNCDTPLLSARNCSYFSECPSLESIDLGALNFSKVGQYQSMFYGCKNLREIDMSRAHASWIDKDSAATMFSGCDKLEKIVTGPEGNYRGVFPDVIRSTWRETIYQTFFWENSRGVRYRSSQIPSGVADTYTVRIAYSYPLQECYASFSQNTSVYRYTGKPVEPHLNIRFYGDDSCSIPEQLLKEGTDYTVQYRNNTEPGMGSIVVKGIGKWTGTLEETFLIESDFASQGISDAAVTVASKTYTGKAQKATTVVVKLDGKTLKPGRDYTISSKTGKIVGSYKVTVTGKGAYKGTKTATFKIVPKGTSVSKLAKAKKAFTVKWKKPSKANLKQTTGYQVRYSLKKSMKGAKTKTVKATSSAGKKCTLKVSKLKGGKKYYVQVRTYKKVGGKTYYSSWSKAKAVKTKK